MSTQWYSDVGGSVIGPLTASQLREMARRGQLTPDALVRQGQTGKWVKAGRVKGLFADGPPRPSAQSPPPIPARQTGSPNTIDASPDTERSPSGDGKHIITLGTFGLLVCSASLFWSWFGAMDTGPIVPGCYLIIGLCAGAFGLFLVLGKKNAIAACRSIGLHPFPDKEVKPNGKPTLRQARYRDLASALQLSAVLSFGLGGVLFGMHTGMIRAKGDLVVLLDMLLFGAIPVILAPFATRKKTWAACVAFPVFLVPFLLFCISLVGSMANWPTWLFSPLGLFWGMSGMISLMAGLAVISSVVTFK